MKTTLQLAMYAIVVLAAGAAAAGCQNKPKTAHRVDPEFLPNQSSEAIWNFANAQSAAGAQRDPSLYSIHFDEGGNLNSLGRDKLALMMAGGDTHRPAMLYIAAGGGDANMMSARCASVEAWLKDAGMAENAIALKDGANPMAGSPAVSGLGRLWKTESTENENSSSGQSGFTTNGMEPNMAGSSGTAGATGH